MEFFHEVTKQTFVPPRLHTCMQLSVYMYVFNEPVKFAVEYIMYCNLMAVT